MTAQTNLPNTSAVRLLFAHKTALRYQANDHPAQSSWRAAWFGQQL
jgi:hypothetical protein